MRYLLIASCIIICTIMAASAQVYNTPQLYLFFNSTDQAGATTNNAGNCNPSNPPAGVNPVLWIPVNGDRVATDYVLNDDLSSVTYSPPGQ